MLWSLSVTLLTFCSKPKRVIEPGRRVVAILAGHPEDPNWHARHREAASMLAELGPRCDISSEDRRSNRRGPFTALSTGVSHGSGQVEPSLLQNKPANQEIVDTLNSMKVFQRIAGFASCKCFDVLTLYVSERYT